MTVQYQNRNEMQEAQLRSALANANLPCLLAVLYQLTGDPRWLDETHRPKPTRGFDENNSGGFDPAVQADIRDAAFDAISAWSRGADPVIETPSSAEMVQLMQAVLGEAVDPSFAPMIRRQLGFDDGLDSVEPLLADSTKPFAVIIIGAGISGIAAGIALEQVGIPFVIVEKNDEVGGTWWENRYPGARVDVPTILYSFSFTDTTWREYFGQRDELASYLQETVDSHGIRDRIRFGEEVTEARWDNSNARWTVSLRDNDGGVSQLQASAVITAVGLHNRPKIPDFPGLEDFRGEVFHSAEWPSNAAIDGKRVGVVGSGASAMQIVPAIAERVASLDIFQRSAHWIIPNESYFNEVSAELDWLLHHVSFFRQWYRFRLHWLYAERVYPALQVDPSWDQSKGSVNAYSEANRRFYVSYLRSQLEGREDLIEKVIPTFPPFGRRILLDNGWYETLKRENVQLSTGEIQRITPDGVRTDDGQEHPLDTLVLCTGFQQQRFLFPLEIYGVDGGGLADQWRDDDARALYGITSPGFPNLFYLFGPNTNPPGGSWITVAEAQVRYIVSVLTTMVRQDIAAVDCRADRYEEYNERVDQANSQLVFGQPGVTSYYRNAAGRVVTNSPWTTVDYWSSIAEPNLDDFVITPVRAVQS